MSNQNGPKMVSCSVSRGGKLCGVFAMLLFVTGCLNNDNDAVEGVLCFDDVDCRNDDLCTIGVCRSPPGKITAHCSFSPIDCDDFNACTVDTCRGESGVCEHTPVECPPSQVCDPGTGMCVGGGGGGTGSSLAVANIQSKLGISDAVGQSPAQIARRFVDSILQVLGFPEPPQEITSVGSGTRALAPPFSTQKRSLRFDPTSAQVQGSLDSLFPCGPGDNGFTVCPNNPTAFVQGDYVVIAVTFEEAVPLEDTDRFYQYAVVFDADNDTSNNYVALPEFPGDLFQNSDLWYSAEYDPSVGWRLIVTDARDNNFVSMASGARMIFKDNGMVLVVPTNEFTVDKPAFRVTSFCHDGGFGFDGGFSTGDYEPAPDEPLRPMD